MSSIPARGRLALILLTSILLCLGTAVQVAAAPGGKGPVAGDFKQDVELRQRLRDALVVLHRHAGALKDLDDVVGTGLGVGPDGEPLIRVFTATGGARGIPAALEGVRVRSEVSGRFYALRGPTCESSGDNVCQSTERWPLPVPIGVSIGHPAITAGTIGARVTDGPSVFILSNNHVLANSNGASYGDSALQPGDFDGGVNNDDAIGTLSDWEPISFCTVFFIWLICDQTNTMDAAVAMTTTAELGVSTPMGEYGSAVGYGVPSSALHSAYGDPTVLGDESLVDLLGIGVQKYGRTTERTFGTVDTVNMTVDVCYDSGCTLIARFVDQINITPGTFSAGGDSGSLVVTNDVLKQPVGLLFAGGSAGTIANRIDRVLNRFGVTIDEGGAVDPLTDAALAGIDAPSSAVVNQSATVTVTVSNVGNQAATGIDVTLTDDGTEVGTQTVNDLDPGASVDLDFDWTPTTEGQHTLAASLTLSGDENPANDSDSTQVHVLGEPPAGGPQLALWQGQVRTDTWTTVDLSPNDYGQDMVVVCTPSYSSSATGPAMVRVKNAVGSSFQVGLARPWFGGLDVEHFGAQVHCMVVREGVYTAAADGVDMEAVKLQGFASTDNSGSWSGVSQPYGNPGYSSPVVLGQVVSADDGNPPSHCPAASGNVCDPVWSVFWSRGSRANRPPDGSNLYVGRHTGEDPNGRAAETLHYVVIESGSGSMSGVDYVAALGADSVRGMSNSPPYNYPLSGLASASTAILGQAAMDGRHGSWAVLWPNSLSATGMGLVVDEDWYLDSERSHTTEQVGYIVFE